MEHYENDPAKKAENGAGTPPETFSPSGGASEVTPDVSMPEGVRTIDEITVPERRAPEFFSVPDLGEITQTAAVEQPHLNPATAKQFHEVYDETLAFLHDVAHKYAFYPDVLGAMRDGEATVELRKRFMLKAIDETWVRVIEDSITALDEIIRKPGRFIEENEEILPIELSRHISSRSVRHLAQHTDFISSVEGDTITPSKILNVFYDETMMTYENKFINTLINRLYGFVSRRYTTAIEQGKDEKTTALEIKQTFEQGGVKGKIDFHMEISEEPKEGDTVKNYTYTTDLWQRVIRLNNICRAYVNSEFAKNMGKAFIRPPVMRTNPILKNRNLRQCLALWEFIESYERTGCEMVVHEDLEKLDARYVEELYQNAALQYSIFRYQVRNAFEPENMLAENASDGALQPEIKEELKPLESSDFDVTLERNLPMPGDFGMDPNLTDHDWDLLEAIEIALEAAGFEAHPLNREIEPAVELEEPPQEEIEEEIVEEEPEANDQPKPLGLQLTMEQWRSLLLRNAISTGLITAAATLAAAAAIGRIDSGYGKEALVREAERVISAVPELPQVVPEAVLQMGGIDAYPFYFLRAKGKGLAETIAMFGLAAWKTVRDALPKNEKQDDARILPPFNIGNGKHAPRSSVTEIPDTATVLDHVLGENTKASLKKCGAVLKRKAADFAATAMFGVILLDKMAERKPAAKQTKGKQPWRTNKP